MAEDIKETVYEHMSGNDSFTVTAAESWSIAMIKRLARERPDEVEIVAVNNDGSILAHVPFDWMRIVPKKRVELTEERREELRERAKALHAPNQ